MEGVNAEELGFVTFEGHDVVNNAVQNHPNPVNGGRDRDRVAVNNPGVQRKRRMARQKKRSSVNLLSLPSTASDTCASPLSSREIDPRRLRFLFQKELKNSDVSSLRRMVIPKKAAESHLPILESKEGIVMHMDDIDGVHIWSFRYRFWPNNNSRMYVLENTGDFVNAHDLRLGDFVMLYQDYETQAYVIGARKASDQDPHTNHAIDAINGIIVQDLEVNRPMPSYLNFSRVEETSTPFVYDTSFSNDSLFDFLSGSMMHYPRKEPMEGFGSVSLDDFY
ncbi:B3 DNA binding domain [Dillenia turbinata]|uniref:B3 DNA binding domain n=1 Tax=Dillenia turbinata TaxID=194707 RepID=A0AAN8UKM4_9MAGN